MKKTWLLIFGVAILLALLNAGLVFMASPSREQQARNQLFRAGQDVYSYRATTGSWPESLYEAWDHSPVLHKPDWKTFSTDPWGNPVKFRIEDTATAFVTISRKLEKTDLINMDFSYQMECRLSTDDPMFDSYFPITNSLHDSSF